MNRRDKLDLFMTGTEKAIWTKRMIDEFIESFENEIEDARRELRGDTLTGIRKETVNGETKTYELVDGEWEEVTPTKADAPFELDEEDGKYTMTMDMAQYLPLRDFDVSASLNNGVLEVSFELPE